MRFVVLASALDGDDSVLDLIDRLVDRLADQVHLVEVPDADLLQESSWYRSARPTRRKVLTSAVANPPKKQSSRGPHLKTVQVADADSARNADRLAHTPLVVLVEDRESDGVLLEILVEELGWPALRELWDQSQQVTPGAVEIDTAGGIDAIPQRIVRSAEDATREQQSPRLFVICDSDARWPGDTEGLRETKINRVLDTCEEYDVPHHVWRKRSAENYIPDEVFETVRDDPDGQGDAHRFNALLRRKRKQRDHFPVKDGLKPKERKNAIEAELYDHSEEVDLRLLEKRLFPGRKRPLLKLQREYRSSFTAEGLRRRDGADEIDEVLRAIAEEL